jgi:hypothetical protein
MTARNARVALGLATLTALGLAASQPARADFSGAYAASNWTASGDLTPTVTASNGTSTLDFNYSVPGLSAYSYAAQTWTYAVTAAGTGPVTFNYSFTFNNGYSQAQAFFQVVSNGATTTFYNSYSGPTTISGTGTVTAVSGTPLQFQIGGDNYDSSTTFTGDLTLTNFVAPAAAPEPSQYAGLGLGVLGLAGLAFKARRQTRTA